MTAAEMKVTEWVPGMRFRITDADHGFAGRSGVLELCGGRTYLLIDGRYVPVRPEQVVLVELRVVT